jgi:hypothetical protein
MLQVSCLYKFRSLMYMSKIKYIMFIIASQQKSLATTILMNEFCVLQHEMKLVGLALKTFSVKYIYSLFITAQFYKIKSIYNQQPLGLQICQTSWISRDISDSSICVPRPAAEPFPGCKWFWI